MPGSGNGHQRSLGCDLTINFLRSNRYSNNPNALLLRVDAIVSSVTVLSDTTIKSEMSQGRLVPSGDPGNARHCAYEFKVGRITFGGTTDGQANVIDLTSGPAKSATIPPSGIAWVRSDTKVAIPADMVGLWIQTNSLSRRGLLLLNSTLVEPGYEGYLAAHLVNLGAQPATLKPNDTIAKLLFLRLDETAGELIDGANYTHYDSFIEGLAASSTSSFLRINEFTEVGVKKLVETAEAEARNRILKIKEGFEAEAQSTIETAQNLEWTHHLKILGGYGVGLLLFIAMLCWALPMLRSLDTESEARIERIVRKQAEDHTQEIKMLREELRAIQSTDGDADGKNDP